MRQLEELCHRLEAEGHRPVTDKGARRAAARDFAWLSPILTSRLGDRAADIVVFPEHGDAISEVVALAVAYEVPITSRGRGTGNYGQSVPLDGGLVIDTTRCAAILDLDDETITVEPGAVCSAVELAANAVGRELTIFPSTTESTIGGFVSGGAGGSGSIEHGFVWDGFVRSVDVAIPCTPGVHTITEEASGNPLPLRPFLHTYGTVGVFTGLTVRLEPRRSWIGLAASFVTIGEATRATRELLDRGLPMRLLGASESALVAPMPSAPWLDPTRASLRAVVEEAALDEAVAVVVDAGGRVDGAGAALVPGITRCSYNHVTLYAKRADARVCHLQVGGLRFPDHAEVLANALPDSRLHVDAMRGPSGRELGGLLMSRFVDEPTLRAGMERLRAAGVSVVDPHTWHVFDPDGSVALAASVTDPGRLLNPGKLVRHRDGAALSA